MDNTIKKRQREKKIIDEKKYKTEKTNEYRVKTTRVLTKIKQNKTKQNKGKNSLTALSIGLSKLRRTLVL